MPAFEFLSYDELMFVAVGGLFLVLRNWWDWFRDAFEHPAPHRRVAGRAGIHRRGA